MKGTFCFVDVAGFTALSAAHGAEAAADLVERFVGLVRSTIGRRCSLVDLSGDSVFVVSTDPGDALGFLRRLQAASAAETAFPLLRAGLHEGEAVERFASYFGPDVNLASRVASHAKPGQVVTTHSVADFAANRLGMQVRPLGAIAVKNIVRPVEMFLVSIAEVRTTFVIDPVCRMRVLPTTDSPSCEFAGRRYSFCSLDCAEVFSGSPADFVAALGDPVLHEVPVKGSAS